MRLCFVTPRVPPSKCGVGDYTWRVAAEAAKTHEVFVVTTRGQTATAPGGAFEVRAEVPGWGPRGMVALWRTLRQIRPTWVSVQYVPFLYHAKGLNVWLPLLILALRAAGVQVALHIHEPFVELDSPKHVAVGLVQRLVLMLLLLGSRKVAVTVAAWTTRFQRWRFWSPQDVFRLPVCSNIPRLPCSPEERIRRRAHLGVGVSEIVLAVFSPLGSGKLTDFVAEAWRRACRDPRVACLLVIGADRAELSRSVGDLPRADVVRCTGYMSAEDVSRLLSCVDIFLSPFIDGISGRRTSALTALEHGLAVVTTRGYLTDADLFDECPAMLTTTEASDEFCDALMKLIETPTLRMDLAARAPRFFEDHFELSRLVHRLLVEIQR